MKKNKLVAPVLKWVGGKRQLLDILTPLLPKRITTYCEPFVGGGAVMRGIVGAAHTKCSGAPARLSLCNTPRGGGKGGGSKPPPYGGWRAIRESPLRADERCSPLR